MGQPAAKQGDRVVAVDIHLIQPPGPSSPVPVPHPFSAIIDNSLSANVNIEGRPAATLGSTATNTPSHIPIGGTFVNPPRNQATIFLGSATVFTQQGERDQAELEVSWTDAGEAIQGLTPELGVQPEVGDFIVVVGHPGVGASIFLEHQYTTGYVTSADPSETLDELVE